MSFKPAAGNANMSLYVRDAHPEYAGPHAAVVLDIFTAGKYWECDLDALSDAEWQTFFTAFLRLGVSPSAHTPFMDLAKKAFGLTCAALAALRSELKQVPAGAAVEWEVEGEPDFDLEITADGEVIEPDSDDEDGHSMYADYLECRGLQKSPCAACEWWQKV